MFIESTLSKASSVFNSGTGLDKTSCVWAVFTAAHIYAIACSFVAVGYASKPEKLPGFVHFLHENLYTVRVNMPTGFIEYFLHLLISSYVCGLFGVLFSANLQFHQFW